MIRQVLSEHGDVLPAAVSFFLFFGIFCGVLIRMIKAPKGHFAKAEELPFHD